MGGFGKNVLKKFLNLVFFASPLKINLKFKIKKYDGFYLLWKILWWLFIVLFVFLWAAASKARNIIFYLKYFLIIYLIVHSFTHTYAIVNKTVNIYLIRIYQVGTILLCEKHNIFRICMSTFSKTRKFSTIREGNIWLDLWKYKRHLYVVIRRGSFSGKGSRKNT